MKRIIGSLLLILLLSSCDDVKPHFQWGDKVQIKSSGVIGTIVDSYCDYQGCSYKIYIGDINYIDATDATYIQLQMEWF
jgi:hypothetical protein